MRARAAGSEGGDDAGIQFDRLRPSQAPPLVGWRGRDIPDVAEGRRENTEFTRELTPYGLYLQEAVVSTAGSTLPDEPVWFRFKAEVGEVGKRKREQFVVDRLLPDGGLMVQVTLERPLGIVFEPDTAGRVRAGVLLDGFQAAQRAAVAQLNQTQGDAVLPGDMLRAFTTTVLDFPNDGLRASLVGDLTGTVRKVVLFGVDEQPWEKTAEALRGGLKADGEVTLLLERPAEGSPYSTWTAVEDKRATQAREAAAAAAAAEEQKREKKRAAPVAVDPLSGEAIFDQDGRDAGKAVLVSIGFLVFLLLAGLF